MDQTTISSIEDRIGRAPVPILGMLEKQGKRLHMWEKRYFTVRSHYLLYARTSSFFAPFSGGVDLLGPETQVKLDRAKKTLSITGVDALPHTAGLPSIVRTMVLREDPLYAKLTAEQHARQEDIPPSLQQWALALVANIDTLRATKSRSEAAKAAASPDASAPSGGGGSASAAAPTPSTTTTAEEQPRSMTGRYCTNAARWLRSAGSAALCPVHHDQREFSGEFAEGPSWRQARLADDLSTIKKDFARFGPNTVVDVATRALFCGEEVVLPSAAAASDAEREEEAAVTGSAGVVCAAAEAGGGDDDDGDGDGGASGAYQAAEEKVAEEEEVGDVEDLSSAADAVTKAKVAEIIAASRGKAMRALGAAGRDVICASIYTHLEPGYAQGMHWIAALCVCCAASQEEAETVFSTLVQHILPRDFWSRPPAGMNGAIADAEVVRDVLLETQPELVAKHGEMMVGILAQVVGIKIMVPLFVGEIRLDTTLAIWDELFLTSHPDIRSDVAEAQHVAAERAAKRAATAAAALTTGTATKRAEFRSSLAMDVATKVGDGEVEGGGGAGAALASAPVQTTPKRSRSSHIAVKRSTSTSRRILEAQVAAVHTHTTVPIATVLALFETVMEQLVASKEGAFLMTTAEDQIRTVSADAWRASYRTVLQRNPAHELAERRRVVKRRLAANWSQPSALRTLAQSTEGQGALAVFSPGKSAGDAAVVGGNNGGGDGNGVSSLSPSGAFALSEIEVAVLQERFNAALAAGGHIGGAYAGGVRRGEFDHVLDSLLGTEEARSEEWDDALFILMDRDNDGTVDFREMICALSTLCRGSLEQRLALAFEAFDTDCSGFLEQDECDRMVALLDAHAFDECGHSEGRGLSQLAVKLKLADANGDGKLSFDEVGEERRGEKRRGVGVSRRVVANSCSLFVLSLPPLSHTLPLSRARALSLTLPQFIAACEHDPEMQHAFGCRIPIDLKEHYAKSKQTAAEQGGCAADCCVM